MWGSEKNYSGRDDYDHWGMEAELDEAIEDQTWLLLVNAWRRADRRFLSIGKVPAGPL